MHYLLVHFTGHGHARRIAERHPSIGPKAARPIHERCNRGPRRPVVILHPGSNRCGIDRVHIDVETGRGKDRAEVRCGIRVSPCGYRVDRRKVVRLGGCIGYAVGVIVVLRRCGAVHEPCERMLDPAVHPRMVPVAPHKDIVRGGSISAGGLHRVIIRPGWNVQIWICGYASIRGNCSDIVNVAAGIFSQHMRFVRLVLLVLIHHHHVARHERGVYLRLAAYGTDTGPVVPHVLQHLEVVGADSRGMVCGPQLAGERNLNETLFNGGRH